MELEYTYADYAADKAIELIGIDSPSGYTRKAADWVKEALGSGNAGAANAARTLGAGVGALTLLGDFLKGVISMLLGSCLDRGYRRGFAQRGNNGKDGKRA